MKERKVGMLAKARLKLLDKSEEDLIHASSIETLEKIGVLVRSPTVLRMLGNAGAKIDERSMIAKIPEGMVNEAIKKAPKSFVLCSRDGKHDLRLPADPFPYVGSNGIGTYMTDFKTGKKRETTRKDIADFARLADALTGTDFFWSNVTAYDVPERTHMVHALWVSLQNCTKSYGTLTLSAEDARAQVELASLIVGGKDELRKRPIFHSLCCVIAPLSFEKGAIEGQVEFAKAGIPVISMSMSLCGMSAPVTLAGTVTNANTENLASLVITQTAAPGAPHIYCSESEPASMVTGNIVYEAPEAPLIAAAAAQMAHRYNLPTFTGSWGANGEVPGVPLSFCELSAIALTMLTGTDMAAGSGGLEEAKGASLEQLVIDSYLWENYRAFLRKFEVSEKTIALDVVREVGHGNSFLTHPHTARNFKKELFFWDKEKSKFEATRSTAMVPEAKKIASKILKEHKPEPIDPKIVEKGNKIIAALDKELST
ncbi:MAG: trimethylamine methyltransferase family protein [Thermoplasmata archaeon]